MVNGQVDKSFSTWSRRRGFKRKNFRCWRRWPSCISRTLWPRHKYMDDGKLWIWNKNIQQLWNVFASDWLYFVNSFPQLARIPKPQWHMAVAIHDNKLFTIGGIPGKRLAKHLEKDSTRAATHFERYNESEDAWTAMEPMIRGVESMASTIVRWWMLAAVFESTWFFLHLLKIRVYRNFPKIFHVLSHQLHFDYFILIVSNRNWVRHF